MNPSNPSNTPIMPSYEPPDGAGGSSKDPKDDTNAAADLIRQKINSLYAAEPNAQEEAKEVAAQQAPYSKHQAFVRELSSSGKSLAELQTAWHNYYVGLPDNEKHEV